MPHILGLSRPLTPGSVDLRVATDKYNSSSCTSTWWSENDVLYTLDGGEYVWTFNRFQNVTIPKGAIITSAVMSLVPKWWGSAPAPADLVSVGIQQADNAAATSGASDIQARFSGLGSTLDWITSGWTLGNPQGSPDLSSALQSLVNRSGWASGNALVVVTRNKVLSTVGLACHSGPSYAGNSSNIPRFQASYLA